jgi:hypothetical protein
MFWSTIVQQEGNYLATSALTTILTSIIYVLVGTDGHQETENYLMTTATKILGADDIIFTMVRQICLFIVVAVLHCWPGCQPREEQEHLYRLAKSLALLKPRV